MAEEKQYHFFKANVKYSVSVRKFPGDQDGVMLTGGFGAPLEVKASDLKYFKQANKSILLKGLIIEVDEPLVDWETANQLTDEQIQDLLKTPTKLYNVLPTIDSAPILHNILIAAKEKGSAPRVTKAIQDRLDVVEPPIDEFSRPE